MECQNTLFVGRTFLFPEGAKTHIGVTAQLVLDGGGNRRRKRSVDPADDMAFHQRYEFNPDTSHRTQTWTWPTASGITEAQANQICKDTIINSNAHDFCHDKFGDAIYDSVSSCVADILVREKLKVFSFNVLIVQAHTETQSFESSHFTWPQNEKRSKTFSICTILKDLHNLKPCYLNWNDLCRNH